LMLWVRLVFTSLSIVFDDSFSCWLLNKFEFFRSFENFHKSWVSNSYFTYFLDEYAWFYSFFVSLIF
jgi:hypothetical protein